MLRDPFTIDEPAPADELLDRLASEQVLADRYRLGEHLHSCALTAVWSCIDLDSDSPCVIKLLGVRSGEARGAVDSLLQELERAQHVEHPGLCRVLAVGEAEQMVYQVMAHVPGQSLQARLAQGDLSVEMIFLILHQVFDALDTAHRHQLVHGQLSLARIMLTPEARAVVLGLGWRLCATLQASAHSLDEVPEHASPEQRRGEPLDVRTDVYGLGLLMRHLLTGQTQVAQALAQPLRLPDLAPGDVQQLDRFLERALANQRDQRFASVRELGSAFRGALFDGEHVTSTVSVRGNEAGWLPETSAASVAPSGVISSSGTATWVPAPARELPIDEQHESPESHSSLGDSEPLPPAAIEATDLAFDGVRSAPEAVRYQLEGEQGRGGAGRILRAYDRHLERAVALKVLLRPSAAAAARFVREAKVSAQLQHPSIVPVYDMGRAPNGEPFYTMKLISGRSLQDLLRQATDFESRLKLLPHVLAVSDAMAYAHSHHIIHRDLKPSNVLVGDFGETVIIDWGLAKDTRESSREPTASVVTLDISVDLTTEGTVVGTAAYMPPEQALGRAVDARADVYAIGAILLQLVTGQLPYPGSTAQAVLAQVRRGPSPLLERLPAEVPADLAAIIRKAVARPIRERYPNARELADDLRRYLTGQLVGAHEYSRMTLLGRWLNHYRLPVAMTGIFLFLLLGAGFVMMGRIVRERNRAEERNHQLILVQARAALERDPTQTLAWLKLYPATGKDWRTARDLALDAYSRGVAEHVFRKTEGKIAHAAFSPDGSLAAAAGPAHALRVIDLGSGRIVDHHADNDFVRAQFTPDGTTIVFSEPDSGALRLWHRPNGQTRVLASVSAAVAWFVLSPAAEYVATTHFDGTFTVEALATGRRILATMLGGLGVNFAFSPSGQTLAYAGSDNAVHLFDIAREQTAVLPALTDPVESVAYSPQGSYLGVRTVNGQVDIYEPGTGRKRTLPRSDIANFAFAPGETALATVGDDRAVRLWDLQTLRERSLGNHQESGIYIAYAPDGRSIASAAHEPGLRIWWPENNDSRVLAGHRSGIYRVEYAANSQRLLSVSPDRTARIWRLQPMPGQVMQSEGRASRVMYVPGGRHVVVVDDGGAWRWDRRSNTSRRLITVAQGLRSLAVSADGRRLAAGSFSGVVYLLDLAHPETHRELRGHDNRVRNVIFSPDGKQLASAGLDGTVRVWDLASETARVFRGHQGAIHTIALSPDGRLLASAGDDTTVRIWTLANGSEQVRRGHEKPVAQVAFSPDGRLLASASSDGTVRLWQVGPQHADDGGVVIDRHSRAVRTLAFTPDGRTLVAGGDSREVHVCPLAAGPCRVLAGHRDWIEKVIVSHDGHWLASASGDGTVRLWDLGSGLPVMIYRHAAEVTDVAFAPDAQELASTGGTDQTARRSTVAIGAPLMHSGKELHPWLAQMTSAVIQDGEPTTP